MMCTMIDRSTATSAATPPKGKSTVKLDFAYDGGNRGAGGTATLYINGESVGSTRIEPTEFAAFSAGETAFGAGHNRCLCRPAKVAVIAATSLALVTLQEKEISKCGRQELQPSRCLP